MKKVFICSPYRGQDIEKNIRRAKEACRLALKKKCLPYAPHLYFTRFLLDSDYGEREAGLFLGSLWLSECDEIWVIGCKITEGMQREIDLAEELGIPVIRKEYK